MDDESAIPLTQFGDETNQKQCLEMPVCKREAKGESEDRTQKPNCLIRCGNLLVEKLFWLLFFTKIACFVAEIGVYSKQSDFILSTNYSAAKFNGSLEAFEDAKQEHLSKHHIKMFGLILLDLVILAFIFVDVGPYLWSLNGRLLERILGYSRRVLWCVRWENRDVSSEKHEEIKQAMFATFLVVFMPKVIVHIILLDSSSLLSTFYTGAAWIVVVGTCLLVMKLPKRFNIVLLWIITVAHLYVLLFVALCKHKPLYTAFGFKSQPLLIGAIIILYMVAAPYNFFKTFVINWIYQTFERQADHYTTTVGLGSEFCSLFSRISNLTPFQEDWLFSLYRHDHPPHYERVRALNCTGT
ncbi:CAAX prenyl protease 1 like protein [Ditylenchus destructor]|nr:CAAX prenyl protease 1 like protein [Ditylenchus destructor]